MILSNYMNNLYRIFGLALCAVVLFSCGGRRGDAPVFVKDEYGVVEKINPHKKEIYLVFTGHYSHSDSGYFENFDGVTPLAPEASASTYFARGGGL